MSVDSDMLAKAAAVQTVLLQVQQLAPDSGESQDAAATNVQAAKSYEAAALSWAGKQADEVRDGSRTFGDWSKYGDELLANLKDFLSFLQGTSGWWVRLLNSAGQGVAAGADALEARVAALQAEVQKIGELRSAVLDRTQVLSDYYGDLSGETADVLWGNQADEAEATWTRLNSVTDELAGLVEKLRGGTAKLEQTSDGELQAVTLSGPVRRRGLGAVAAVIIVGILGVVATAWALAVWARAYYTHADEVSRAEVDKLLIQAGRAQDVVALHQARAKADQARQPDFDPLMFAGKLVAGAALTVGGVWGVAELAKWLLRRRRKAAA